MAGVVIIVRRIGPYHAARLGVLAETNPVTALEVCAKDDTYAWEQQVGGTYRRVTLFETEAQARDVCALRSRIEAALDAASPDVVAVPGWGDPAALLALEWSRLRGVPALLMSDSRAEDAPRNVVAEALKRRVVAVARAALVAGHAHADYLVSLGMARESIFLGYDVVDNAHFSNGADAMRADGDARARLKLPERYLLAVGRFVPKKNFSALLNAHARWRVQAPNPVPLVLVGEGPLKESFAARIGGGAILRPFATYAELPALYGLAEGFVFPSATDQWGLVVNEAMAAGCPVIASSQAGATAELIEDGLTGLSTAPNETALAEALHRFAAADRPALASAARAKIADWDLDRFAAGFVEAADFARSATRRSDLFSAAILRVLARSIVV